jgi:hypothetical protein
MKRLSLSALFLLVGWLSQLHAFAANPVVFTIDPTRSRISISGKLVVPGVGTYAFQQQGPGSLTTSYSGSILANLVPPSIGFPGGSSIQAHTSGSWQPGIGGISGPQSADYGILIQPLLTTVDAAIRNIRLDLTGANAVLSNGGFDAGGLATTFLTNTLPKPSLDFRASSLVPSLNTNGTALLTGTGTNSPSTAYLTNTTGLLTLVLPVNTTKVLTVGGNATTVILQGQVIATAPGNAWPLRVSIKVQPSQVTLTWPSLPGQKFAVQSKPDLTGSWNPAAGTMTVHSNTTTWTAGVTGETEFYRVVGIY